MLPNPPDPTTDYGLPKENRDALGPVDPHKEIDANEYERLAVDMAAAGHCVPRAMVKFTNTGGTTEVTDWDSVWGSSVSVKPTFTDNGAGDITITWAAAGYPDLNPTASKQVTTAPNFRFAHAMPITTTPTLHIAVSLTSNTVRVTSYDGAVMKDCDFYVFVY